MFIHCSQFYNYTVNYGRPLILLKTHVVLVKEREREVLVLSEWHVAPTYHMFSLIPYVLSDAIILGNVTITAAAALVKRKR